MLTGRGGEDVKPTLLLCNIPGGKLGALRLCAVRLGCRMVAVPPVRQGMTVGQLLTDAPGECPPEELFTEELLVMDGLPAGGLDLLLETLRRQRCAIAWKAVVTPTNRDWPLEKLFHELGREREALEKGTAAHTGNAG